jgi:hypothetical protein
MGPLRYNPYIRMAFLQRLARYSPCWRRGKRACSSFTMSRFSPSRSGSCLAFCYAPAGFGEGGRDDGFIYLGRSGDLSLHRHESFRRGAGTTSAQEMQSSRKNLILLVDPLLSASAFLIGCGTTRPQGGRLYMFFMPHCLIPYGSLTLLKAIVDRILKGATYA